jgi:hypothetical protein
MKNFIAPLFFCFALCVSAFAQSKDFTVSTSADECIAQGVTVKLSYKLPEDDPLVMAAKTNPGMQPAVAIWYWGDEAPGAKTRSYSQLPYVEGQTLTHLYRKPGTYGVTVLVNDTKNRNIRQAAMQIVIHSAVEIK